MECKDFEPSIIQDNKNEYINISKAFSSSLVEKADASIALNSFVPINKVAEIDKAIADKEQLIEKLAEYKKSLIYECVTGKRKVV